jgi:hypothetical protein
LAGCTPAEPASASPTDSIFIESAATVNRNHQVGGGIFNQQNEEFSVGIDTTGEIGAVEIESQWTAARRGNQLPEHLRYREESGEPISD